VTSTASLLSAIVWMPTSVKCRRRGGSARFAVLAVLAVVFLGMVDRYSVIGRTAERLILSLGKPS
jgi:hypothetical protein